MPFGGFGDWTGFKMAVEDDDIAFGDSERDEFELFDDVEFLTADDACFSRDRAFTSDRLFNKLFREYLASDGIDSSMASSLIMSIRFAAPFTSSFCSCLRE